MPVTEQLPAADPIALQLLQAAVPLGALLLSAIALFVQARSHRHEVQRLTIGESYRRSTWRRELVLEQVEPLLARLEDGSSAFHRLTNFIAWSFGFGVIERPGFSKSEGKKPIGWYQHPDQDVFGLEFGARVIRFPEDPLLRDKIRSTPDASVLQHMMERYDDSEEESGWLNVERAVDANQVLFSLVDALEPAIARSKIFGFSALEKALTSAHMAAREATTPANICVHAVQQRIADGHHLQTENSIVSLQLFDQWFLGSAQKFIDANEQIVDALRLIVGESNELDSL